MDWVQWAPENSLLPMPLPKVRRAMLPSKRSFWASIWTQTVLSSLKYIMSGFIEKLEVMLPLFLEVPGHEARHLSIFMVSAILEEFWITTPGYKGGRPISLRFYSHSLWTRGPASSVSSWKPFQLLRLVLQAKLWKGSFVLLQFSMQLFITKRKWLPGLPMAIEGPFAIWLRHLPDSLVPWLIGS